MKLLLSCLLMVCSFECFAQDCFIDRVQGNFESMMGYRIVPYADGTSFSVKEREALDRLAPVLPEFFKNMPTLISFERATPGKHTSMGGSGLYSKLEKKISIADLGLYERNGRLASPFYKVVAHEMAHAFDAWKGMISRSSEWSALPNEFITGYAKSSPTEDFAETMAYFILYPDELLREAPTKFEYISKTFFDGKRFDTASLKSQYEMVLSNLSGEERARKIALLKQEDYYACQVFGR